MAIFTFFTLCILALQLVNANYFVPASDIAIHNIPYRRGSPIANRIVSFQNNVAAAIAHGKRDNSKTFKNSTSIAKSWQDATLFSHTFQQVQNSSGQNSLETTEEITITCVECYLTATATAELDIDGSFNFSGAVEGLFNEFEQDLDNLTSAFENYVEGAATSIFTDLSHLDFHIDDLIDDIPPFQVELDFEVPDVPQVKLRLQFDDMELYVKLDTVITADITYTLNLFTSESPIGIAVGKDYLGVILAVDLILSAEGSIDVSSGFHIKFDDGAALELNLFSTDVSKIDFNGGAFEFLPVTIVSASLTLKAVLRIGVNAGFNVVTPPFKILGKNFGASAGIGAGVYVNVAEFAGSVTTTPAGDENNCQVALEESYNFVLGAQAGATVAVGKHTWGPTPNTSTTVWGTTFTQCAVSAAASSSDAVTAFSKRRRQDDGLTTTTISTEVTFVGVQCLSSGLVNCPASLQSTTKTSTSITLITSVPSGVDATFPATTQDTVDTRVPFGASSKKLFVASGTPTPGAGSTDTSAIIANKIDRHMGIIIGVSVGVGVPLIIGLVFGIIWLSRNRMRLAAAPAPAPVPPPFDPRMHGQPAMIQQNYPYDPYAYGKEGLGNSVQEVQYPYPVYRNSMNNVEEIRYSYPGMANTLNVEEMRYSYHGDMNAGRPRY